MTKRDKYYQLLDQYVSGNLSIQERHELEKKAIDDPFFFDAMEGWVEMGNADHAYHIDRLQKKIKRKSQSNFAGRILWPVAIAASLLLLFTIGNIITSKGDQTLASANPQEQEEVPESVNVAEEEFKEDETPATVIVDNVKNNPPPSTTPQSFVSPPTQEKAIAKAKKSSQATASSPESKTEVVVAEPEKKWDVKESAGEELASDTPITSDKQNRIPLSGIEGINMQNMAQRQVNQAGPLLIIDEDLENYIQRNLFMQGLKVSPSQRFSFVITFDESLTVTKMESLTEESDIGNTIMDIIKKYKEWKKDTIPPNLYGKFDYPSKKN